MKKIILGIIFLLLITKTCFALYWNLGGRFDEAGGDLTDIYHKSELSEFSAGNVKTSEELCFKMLKHYLSEMSLEIPLDDYSDFNSSSRRVLADVDIGSRTSDPLVDGYLGYWDYYDYGEQTKLNFPNGLDNARQFRITFYYTHDYGLQGCGFGETVKYGNRYDLIGNISRNDFNRKIRTIDEDCDCECNYTYDICNNFRVHKRNATIFAGKGSNRHKLATVLLHKYYFSLPRTDPDNIYMIKNLLIHLPKNTDEVLSEEYYNLSIFLYIALAFLITLFLLIFRKKIIRKQHIE